MGFLVMDETFDTWNAAERHAFSGQCIAIIKAKKASGRITITAASPGLTSGSVTIEIN